MTIDLISNPRTDLEGRLESELRQMRMAESMEAGGPLEEPATIDPCPEEPLIAVEGRDVFGEAEMLAGVPCRETEATRERSPPWRD